MARYTEEQVSKMDDGTEEPVEKEDPKEKEEPKVVQVPIAVSTAEMFNLINEKLNHIISKLEK